MTDNRRGAGQLGIGKLRHLDHFTLTIANIITENIIKRAAILGLGLDIDVADLAILVSKTRVVTTSQNSDGVHCSLKVDI